MKLIRQFDFFTKAKEEIDTSTGMGGLFSLLGAAFGILFLLIEFGSFLSSTWVTEMSIENDLLTKKERVNIDITFHKASCHLLSLAHEEEGHEVIEDLHITKERLDANGKSLGIFKPNTKPDYSESEDEINDIKNAINAGEKCRLFGNFSVSEVPGYFEFSYRMIMHVFRRLTIEEYEKVSLAFTLNHMTVGMDPNHEIIRRKYGQDVKFSPYDGMSVRDMDSTEHYQMFIKLCSNYYFYKEDSENGLQAYQYSLTAQKKSIAPLKELYQATRMGFLQMPSLKVTYEFSPITVNHRRKANSFARFLVDTLAIIGGIFSVFGMLNSYSLNRFKEFIK